ncbi:streptophobe family protein [Streptomyces sp. AD681]|uniref:streptophobe family protein n=1 Tax=Streptomyces sp. AD681 TaxID=3019069 RepID=UPI0022F19808|nr:streptophobe family protein [Streptomyces sp. AD681]MDA5147224.1 streptophobe family protein [Streptomyces sp. AD681]
MNASTSVGTKGYGTGVPWGDVLLSAIASVSWALIGMAGTAALGLHLLDADAAGALGPMTAAVVALGAGGSVTPAGDVSSFGLKGAEAHTAIEITPLGVGLVGALFLSFFFLRSLRAAGVVVAPAELLARVGAVVALFVAMTGGLAWAGHDVVTIDGASLGLDDLPGGGGGGLEIPGLGDVGDIGGLLPDRVGDLVDARAAVGFTVDTAPTLLGGLVWSAGVLMIALLASRRTPLPRGCEALHRVVRPAVSALVTVALTAVAAGLAAAAWAAIGDDHPRRIAGAALLGAPNGVWLGVPLGLFVPWDGRATGALVGVLPAPLDDLLGSGAQEPVTLGRLAELDGRVWLLGVAAALVMLLAGVLTAVRTPVGPGDARPLVLAGRCALRLGVATAVTLPLSALLTEVSVDASLSVLGIDAFGAGIDLRGHLGAALLLGAAWGAGAGAAGALLARVSGAAGTRASGLARSAAAVPGVGTAAVTGSAVAGGPPYAGSSYGPYLPGTPHRPPGPDTNPYLRWREGPWSGDVPAPGTGEPLGEPEDARPAGMAPTRRDAGLPPGPGHTASGAQPPAGPGQGQAQRGRSGAGREGDGPGQYGAEAGREDGAADSWPDEVHREDGAADPWPDKVRREDGAAGPWSDEVRREDGAAGPWSDKVRREDGGADPWSDDDVYGAPTVAGPLEPHPGQPPRHPRRPGERPPSRPWGEGPPPPPPPPPAPPRRPRDGQ